MDLMIKEARAEYGLTQKDLSEITDIPLRTIENWESGRRKPSPWVEKMVYSYLKQYPKNQHGIITETKGIYEINQIKDALLPLTLKYDINKIILYGSYAKGKQEPLSDIDLVVDGNIRGIKFFGLLEDVNNALVKSVDLIHFSQIDKNSEIYENIMKGIVLYER
ncbi:MAG: helix-turn-helix domain-containing protein [Acholeplasmataceae bacterium]|nr:helix-turn-helix domain-containing protein [Acholeplasmataceae bacterium]